jgi:predicted small lipoprotein YifL
MKMKEAHGMIKKGLFLILILSLLLTSCGQKAPTELPTPQSQVTTFPDVDSTAQAFLKAWSAQNYTTMYAMLSDASKKAISQSDFTAYYTDAVSNATIQSIETTLGTTSISPDSALAACHVVYSTSYFGSFDRDITLPFTWENGSWKVSWDSGLIMPELANGNHLSLEVLTNTRGSIFDSNGSPIAQQATAWSLAIIPNQIEEGTEGQLLNILSKLTGRRPNPSRLLMMTCA